MALKYQFNKISLQNLRKQLQIRISALPTLKSKESALRLTLKKYKNNLKTLRNKFDETLASIGKIMRLLGEFRMDIFDLNRVNLTHVKIAGVKIPELSSLDFELRDFSRFINPNWFTSGIAELKQLAELLVNISIIEKSIDILEYARKKTTQKVNLYEKVQIPLYSEAIIKIKRFLEDVENLEKAAQKITKQRQSVTGS